jgi:hypothetical protein
MLTKSFASYLLWQVQTTKKTFPLLDAKFLMKKHALLWNMFIHHMHMCSTPWMSLKHWVKLEPKFYAQILDVKE